jgi:hypothetical protein
MPTIAFGVWSRTASRANFAIRPETYATTPLTILRAKPRRPSAGDVELIEMDLAAGAEQRLAYRLSRDAKMAVGSRFQPVGFEDSHSGFERSSRCRRIAAPHRMQS